MARLRVGGQFSKVAVNDIDGAAVKFPAGFARAPSTVILVYRGRW